jgi:transcriptional regulator with XRE-family HTH domain
MAFEGQRPAMVQTSVVKEVGRRIRQLRLSRVGPRMTQEDLSERARISVSFLSMIERGERSPHLETLAKIAEALEVRLAALFTSDEGDDGLEPVFKPLLDACRKYNLGKRDVDRLVGVVRTMFA